MRESSSVIKYCARKAPGIHIYIYIFFCYSHEYDGIRTQLSHTRTNIHIQNTRTYFLSKLIIRIFIT